VDNQDNSKIAEISEDEEIKVENGKVAQEIVGKSTFLINNCTPVVGI